MANSCTSKLDLGDFSGSYECSKLNVIKIRKVSTKLNYSTVTVSMIWTVFSDDGFSRMYHLLSI